VNALLEIGLVNALVVTILAVIVALVTCVCRRPALAHALWLVVLLKLIAPPLVAIQLPWPQPALAETVPLLAPPQIAAEAVAVDEVGDQLPRLVPLVDDAAAPVVAAPESPPAPPPALEARVWRPSWQAAVAVIWLVGAGLWWLIAAVRLERFRRLLKVAQFAPAALQRQACNVAERLGLARCPGVWLLPAPVPPLLWVLGGPPRVFLPAALWYELSGAQQDTLLAHELSHLRRRDHWVRWLELLAVGLYWWLPTAWWARRALHDAEELLCDARVVRTFPAGAGDYAAALVHTVRFLSGPRPALPGAASGLGHFQALKGRIIMILRGTNADRLPRAAAWALVVLGLAALALRPDWGTNPASAAEPQTPPAAEPVPTRTVTDEPTPSRDQKLPPGADPRRNYGTTPGDLRPDVPKQVRGYSRALASDGEIDVELLKVVLQSKRADLQVARVLVQRAQKKLARLEELRRQGAVSEEICEEARYQVNVSEANLRGKEAQLREAELRLEQAARGHAAKDAPRFNDPLGGDRPAREEPSPVNTPRRDGRASGDTRPVPPVVEKPADPNTRRENPYDNAAPTPQLPGARAIRPPAVPPADRLLQLEKQIERLQREVQELRDQLRAAQSRDRRVPG
jgi:beta-lactamase regulating signal transducer with metallopeptidase domain